MKSKKLVFNELIKDIKSRDKKGLETYKKPMTTFDGRNSLQDAYEEALDLVVYLKKTLMEFEEIKRNLPDCTGCTDPNSDGTHQLFSRQHLFEILKRSKNKYE